VAHISSNFGLFSHDQRDLLSVVQKSRVTYPQKEATTSLKLSKPASKFSIMSNAKTSGSGKNHARPKLTDIQAEVMMGICDLTAKYKLK